MNAGELFRAFPRMHTAIAEWLACMLYIMPRTKRLHGWRMALVAAGFFGLLVVANLPSQSQDGFLWVLLMAACMGVMLLMIFTLCRTGPWKALYYWAHAFIAAEFAASLEWQINCYLIYGGWDATYNETFICMGVVYALVFGGLWLLNSRRDLMKNQIHISSREAAGAVLIAVSMFTLGNVSFVFRDSVVSQTTGAGVLFVRTLADLSGLILIYAHDEQRREMRLRYELESMDQLLNRQYEQFRQAEANNEAMHRVYHDLKHQLAYIKAEPDEDRRASYISELEKVVSVHEAQADTGNSVLDTLLTSKNLLCVEDGITMTCYADAGDLGRVEVMDICSIFGNAIDNAIEYERKLTDPEKRQIVVTVRTQNQFLIIRIENYCEEHLSMEDGMIRTTKKDRQMHGYGIKSIRRAVEKYDGSVSISQDGLWFVVAVLIPLAGK